MMKGLTTHNIMTAVGYKPAGSATGAPDAAPASAYTPDILMRKSKRLNYVPNTPDPARLAPGVVKLTVGDPTGYRDLKDYEYHPSADFDEALVVASHMYEQSQMPHQWKKEPLPEDNSGNEIENYFNNLSEEQFENKIEALKKQGFTYPQINAAITRMRDREIEKAFKAPFVSPGAVGDPLRKSILSKVHQAKRKKNEPTARTRARSLDSSPRSERFPVDTPGPSPVAAAAAAAAATPPAAAAAAAKGKKLKIKKGSKAADLGDLLSTAVGSPGETFRTGAARGEN